jgi:hypothetical protein
MEWIWNGDIHGGGAALGAQAAQVASCPTTAPWIFQTPVRLSCMPSRKGQGKRSRTLGRLGEEKHLREVNVNTNDDAVTPTKMHMTVLITGAMTTPLPSLIPRNLV